jgi:hypothetical protein
MADSKPPETRIRIGWSGRAQAELVETIPITKTPGERRVVVMSLGPDKDPDSCLPDLEGGDRLEVEVEVEVTTDLATAQARTDGPAVGQPYDYAPAVVAELVLAQDRGSTGPKAGEAIGFGESERLKLDHTQHHGVLSFQSALRLPAGGVPWKPGSHLNLVLSASHENAGNGELLLIGQNEPGGKVSGDMGAICAIRVRPGATDRPKPSEQTKRLVNSKLPLQGEVKRVIYSLPLKDLKKNEQLLVAGRVDASAAGLGYPARLKNRAFLADSPDQVEPDGKGYAASIASAAAQVGKANGFNCLPDHRQVSYSKRGVVRMLDDSRKTLYLNIAGVAGDPEKHGRPDSLELLESGELSVTRISPGAFG